MTDRYQDRGPQSSASFNKNNRETAKRLAALESGLIDVQSRANELERSFASDSATTSLYAEKISQISFAIGQSLDGHVFLPVSGMQVVTKDGVPADENEQNALTNPLFVDERAGLVTLGQSAIEHKLRFEPTPGTWMIHPEVLYSFSMAPLNHHATLTDPKNAIDGKTLRAFMAYGTTPETLEMTYYAMLPHLAVANNKSNMVSIELAPGFHCSLIDLKYSTTPNPSLAEGSHWLPFPVEDNVPMKDRWQVPHNDGNYQDEMSFRRYYFPDAPITGIRAVVRTKFDGNAPLPVDLDGTPTYMVGIRELDVAHVSFNTTGSIVFEADLPKAVATIDLGETQALCVNEGTGGVYSTPVEVYLEVGGTWELYTGGDAGGATKVRIKVSADLIDGSSPAIAGIDFIYT